MFAQRSFLRIFVLTPGFFQTHYLLKTPVSKETGSREFFMIMRNTFIAYIFVLFQFICLIYIGMSGSILSVSVNGLLVQVAGLVLGVSAILQMRIGNFNVAPLPKAGGELITTGIYSVLRHPMYLAQLLVVGPLVVDYFTWPRLIALLILLIDLILKLHFEENNLKRQFAEYEEYMHKTWRLVPYFY